VRVDLRVAARVAAEHVSYRSDLAALVSPLPETLRVILLCFGITVTGVDLSAGA